MGGNILDTGIAVVLGVIVVRLGSPLTTWVFRRVDRDGTEPSPQLTKAASTLRGGRAIGMLERAAVYLTIVAGWPEGVAIVVALKGLGRYGELRGATEGTAERFLIGSLSSLLFAGSVAAAARAVIEAT